MVGSKEVQEKTEVTAVSAELLKETNDEALAQQAEKLVIEESKEKKEEDDEDDNEDDDEAEEGGAKDEASGKKKRKKKKKKSAKKKTSEGTAVSASAAVSSGQPPASRLLGGSVDYFVKYGQTNPPTRPVKDLFPDGRFPQGEILPHGKTKYPDPNSAWARTSEEERR